MPRQGYGELTIKMISLSDLNLKKSFILSKFDNPTITDSTTDAHKLNFRVAFFDYSLDRVSAPVTYSEQVDIELGQAHPNMHS